MDGKYFVVRADEKLTALLELETAGQTVDFVSKLLLRRSERFVPFLQRSYQAVTGQKSASDLRLDSALRV